MVTTTISFSRRRSTLALMLPMALLGNAPLLREYPDETAQ
jgi:hypothetical protein